MKNKTDTFCPYSLYWKQANIRLSRYEKIGLRNKDIICIKWWTFAYYEKNWTIGSVLMHNHGENWEVTEVIKGHKNFHYRSVSLLNYILVAVIWRERERER